MGDTDTTDVRLGLEETDAKYPFIPYGTDWLALSHLVIAVVDMSFGVFGVIPLLIVRRMIKRLEAHELAMSPA